MTTRSERIEYWLDQMIIDHSISSYYSQTNMPGRRWNIGMSGFGTRVYSTAEVEAFITGWRVAKIR